MDFIIRLKAWQLFLLFMILFAGPSALPLSFFSVGLLFAFCLLLLAALIFWVYAVGIKMNCLVPAQFRVNTARFKLYCLLTPACMGIVILLCLYAKDLGINMVLYASLLILLPLSYFYFIFSAFMFAARMLKTVVSGIPANNADAIGEFFCFFPLGVWVIQSAVHRALAKHSTTL